MRHARECDVQPVDRVASLRWPAGIVAAAATGRQFPSGHASAWWPAENQCVSRHLRLVGVSAETKDQGSARWCWTNHLLIREPGHWRSCAGVLVLAVDGVASVANTDPIVIGEVTDAYENPDDSGCRVRDYRPIPQATGPCGLDAAVMESMLAATSGGVVDERSQRTAETR